MGKVKKTNGPYWTKAWIQALWEFTNTNFVDFDTGQVDFEALGREEFNFRKALFFKNFKNSPRAAEAFQEALAVYDIRTSNGKAGGRPPKDENKQKPKSVVNTTNRDAYGDFANVYLTKDEYNEFIRQVGNINEANSIIKQLSASLADGSKESSNHYATLMRWNDYRKEKKSNAPKSFDEHEREVRSRLVQSYMLKTGGEVDDESVPY